MVANFAGCRKAVVPDPASTYQSIHSDFLQGKLESSQERAQKASLQYAGQGDWPVRFILLEAEIATDRGRRPQVLSLLEAPQIRNSVQGDLAIKRYLLCGYAHLKLGQAQQSDAAMQEARRLTDASNSPLNGEVLRTEGLVQLYRGHLPEAADLVQKSLQVARDRHDAFIEASDLLNLGWIAIQQRQYDESIRLLTQAAKAADAIQARVVSDESLGNLGVAYFRLGDFERALSNFQQAEQAAEEIGTTTLQADWLLDAASSYYMLGNIEAAKADLEKSLRPARDDQARADLADIESMLAYLQLKQGQLQAARQHDETALREAQLSGDPSAKPEPLFIQALLAVDGKDTSRAEAMLMRVYAQSADSASLRAQIENALAKFFAGRRKAALADTWYRKSIHTFESQRAEVQDEELRLPFLANGDGLYREYADFLIAGNKQDAALRLLDQARAKTLAEGLRLDKHGDAERPVAAQAIAGRMNGVILFYSLGTEASYLWAIDKHQTRLCRLPGNAEIKAEMQSYQKAILKSTDPLRDANQSAKTLFATLVGPAASMIPKGSRVYIVPDGALNGLNFETLLTPGPDNSHYWIDDVTISSASSIKLLSTPDTTVAARSKEKLLLIGNPVATGTGYNTLVNAFAEIRGLEKHFAPDVRTVITQSEATPAAYAHSNPDQFSYIHFVAHGTASELSPLDSAVVLSAPPGNPDHYKLYAREIMRSPLHARLVTISACYGSGSRSYAGEGLVGLSWAFLRAGSHNVIGALWEVNDASTPLLMDRLYAALEAGRAPDAALREAKLSLVHSDAVYRKPLYWGGFQLYTGS